eukprot:6176791-Pleurochrysis_carterae.AAC.1
MAGLLGAGAGAASATMIDGAFRVGERLTLDCLNHSTSPPVWGSGPVCKVWQHAARPECNSCFECTQDVTNDIP